MTDDRVDEMVAAWRRERPDLAPSLDAMGTIGRLGRLVALGTRHIEAVHEAHGLSLADFDVLAALRRSGPPHELKPSTISRALMLSPAGMTGRLDRLERAGLIDRRMDPDDRRSFLVRLNALGREAVDAAVTSQLRREEEMLAPLSAAERAQLDDLVRRVLAPLEP